MPKKSPAIINVFVGERLRALRLSLGLSQTEFGKVLAVTFQQVQKYEKGVNRLGVAQMLVLRDRYGVSFDYFVPKLVGPAKIKSGDVAKKIKPAAEPEDIQSADGLSLLRAFHTIGDSKLRSRILSFVQAVASEGKNNKA